MDARTRLGWIRLYEQAGNAGIVCRQCGISRPALRKWWRRYEVEGVVGLEARSYRPHHSPGRKVFAEEEALILRLRRERSLGIKMLRNELARRHGVNTSQLFTWRKQLRIGLEPVTAPSVAGFAAVAIAPTTVSSVDDTVPSGLIEIELAGGDRVRISGAPDPGVVAAALRALAGR